MLVNISDGQFHQYLKRMKTFHRVYLQFYQNFMQSSMLFVLRLDLDFLIVVIIRDEYRSIVDKCPLDRATRFLPRLTFVVELEIYSENDHFINI